MARNRADAGRMPLKCLSPKSKCWKRSRSGANTFDFKLTGCRLGLLGRSQPDMWRTGSASRDGREVRFCLVGCGM